MIVLPNAKILSTQLDNSAKEVGGGRGVFCVPREPTAEDQAYPVSNVEEEEMDDVAAHAQLSETPSRCGLQPQP